MADEDFTAGATVVLHSLVARPELNGCTGTVSGSALANGRIPLLVGTERLALKPAPPRPVGPATSGH